jgi:hypothetical protein
MFQLTREEFDVLISQNAMSKPGRGSAHRQKLSQAVPQSVRAAIELVAQSNTTPASGLTSATWALGVELPARESFRS